MKQQMKTVNTIEVEFSRDTYKLEVLEGEFGTKFYHLFINGDFDKSYKRLPSDLREFFNI
jgi:hypothetical protein